MSASADLFDIVKGQLLDEGLSEEEIRDIMLELTPEEILDEMTGLSPEFLTKAATLADKKRGKAAVAGNKELAIKRMKQGEKFSAAAREKKGKPDYSKPYTNTSNEEL